MLTFLAYEGKVAVVLLVFYLFYRFLLKKETFHRFNRVVLVSTAVLSFLLPLCIITIHKTVEQAPADILELVETVGGAAAGPAPASNAVEAATAPWWPTALVLLYFAGVAFVLARIVISHLSIARIIRRGKYIREEDGCKIVLTDRDIDPFSWMRYIVLSRKDWEGLHAPILTHEKAHIAYGHSWELLLVDVLSSLQWFNPAIWMLRADLQELHEYEADDAVLRSGADLRDYQYLLIKKAVSKSGYSVANSFNHSILKNRITMMSKNKSSALRGLRVLYALPLAAVCLAANAQTVIDYKGSDNPQINYYSGPTAINLLVIQNGKDAEYVVNGESVSLEAIGAKVDEVRAKDPSAYVSIIAESDVRSEKIQQVKDELRKVNALKVQYTCFPKNVQVQRRLEPSGAVSNSLSAYSKADGDIHIQLSANDKLLYGGNNGKAIDPDDLFALAKQDVEKNNGVSFYLIVDDGSSYGAYSSAVQTLYYAFKSVREDLAMKTYGKPYDLLKMDQQDELMAKCRANIFEVRYLLSMVK